MLRKCALVASVLAVFGTPAKAQTTMDVSMKIQAVMDQLSGIRSQLKQVQSAINIKEMKQNLQGNGDWKSMLKQAGGIFDRNAEKGGTKQSLLVLPDGLADAIKDPDAANKWLQENLLNQKKNPTPAEKDEETKKISEFKFTALASAFGKAVATRKKLDKDLATIEKLRQDAEAKESETDLQNEINKLALLKMEQANYRQLLMASMVQVETADSLEAAQSQNKKLEKNEEENKEDGNKDKEGEEKAEDADKKDEKDGEKKEEKEKSKLEKLKDQAEEKAKKVEKTVNDAKEKAEKAVNDAKEKADKAINDAKEKAEKAVNDAKEKAEKAVNDAKEKADKAITDAREKTAKAIAGAETKVEGAVKDAKDKVGGAVKDATGKVSGAVNDAKSKAEGAVKDAKGKAEGAVNAAIDKASAAVNKNGKGGTGTGTTAGTGAAAGTGASADKK